MYGLSTPLIFFISHNLDIVLNSYDISMRSVRFICKSLFLWVTTTSYIVKFKESFISSWFFTSHFQPDSENAETDWFYLRHFSQRIDNGTVRSCKIPSPWLFSVFLSALKYLLSATGCAILWTQIGGIVSGL